MAVFTYNTANNVVGQPDLRILSTTQGLKWPTTCLHMPRTFSNALFCRDCVQHRCLPAAISFLALYVLCIDFIKNFPLLYNMNKMFGACINQQTRNK